MQIHVRIPVIVTDVLSNRAQEPVSRLSRQLFGPKIEYSNRNLKNKSAGPGKQTTPF